MRLSGPDNNSGAVFGMVVRVLSSLVLSEAITASGIYEDLTGVSKPDELSHHGAKGGGLVRSWCFWNSTFSGHGLFHGHKSVRSSSI